MGIINSLISEINFTDTIFLKESTTLQEQLNALNKLKSEYPNSKEIQNEFYLVKKGIDGENEIKYQLSKANLGLYVIHDYNIEVNGMAAQIDYVIFSRASCYFIECKNLIGNITVNEKGDFIREFVVNGRKVKTGMYSPLRQVEAQRDVYKKIWDNALSENKIINTIKRAVYEKNYNNNHRVLVVAANHETILNTRFAPKNIKNKVIRSDSLIRILQEDIEREDKDSLYSRKSLEEFANNVLSFNVEKHIDYYEFYKNKFVGDSQEEKVVSDINLKDEFLNDEELKESLMNFRKERAASMNIPAYYVFTNVELDLLVEHKPKTLDELRNLGILTPIKIKTHGNEIVNVINDFYNN